jgi:hypothetical protein
MRKLCFLAALGLLWFGGSNVWHSLRHAEPAVVALTTTNAESLPAHLTLTGIAFSPLDTITSKRLSTQKVYLPVRARSADPKSEFQVLVLTKDPAILNVLHATNPSDLEVLKVYATMAARTEVTGMVDSMVPDSEIKALRKALPLLARNAVVINEGEKPSLSLGLIWLVIGVGLLFVPALLQGKDEPAAPPPPPPLPSAQPPVLPPTLPSAQPPPLP